MDNFAVVIAGHAGFLDSAGGIISDYSASKVNPDQPANCYCPGNAASSIANTNGSLDLILTNQTANRCSP